jgi:hypothetical protein
MSYNLLLLAHKLYTYEEVKLCDHDRTCSLCIAGL